MLKGCGSVVEPEDVQLLAVALDQVLTDRQGSEEMGRRAAEDRDERRKIADEEFKKLRVSDGATRRRDG